MSNIDSLVASALYNYTYDDVVFPDQSGFLDLSADHILPAGSIIPANLDNDTGNSNGGIPAYAAPDFSAYNPDLLSSVEVDDEGSQLAVGVDWDELLRPQPDNNHNNNNNNNMGLVYFGNDDLLGNVDANTPSLYQEGNRDPLAAELAPQQFVAQQVAPQQMMPQQLPPQQVVPQQNPSPSPSPSQEDLQVLQEDMEKVAHLDFAPDILEKTWELQVLVQPNPRLEKVLLSERLKAQYPEKFGGASFRRPSQWHAHPPDQELPHLQAQQPSPSLSPSPVPAKRGPGRPKGSKNKPKHDMDRVMGRGSRVGKSGGKGANSIAADTSKSAGWKARTPGEKLTSRLVAIARAEAKTKLEVHLLDEEQDPVDGADVDVGNNMKRKLSREQLHWQLLMKFHQEALDRIFDEKPQYKQTIMAEEGLMEEMFPGYLAGE